MYSSSFTCSAPGAGEVQVRIRAVGLNFIDVGGFRGMAFAKRKMPQVAGVVASMIDVVQECVAVAEAAGVSVPPDIFDSVMALSRTMAGQRSSTAQDLARGRPSEIDHLNGYVVRKGAALGVQHLQPQTLVGLARGLALGLARTEALPGREVALLDALLSPVISVIKTTPVASFVILVLIWLRRDYVPVLISALMVFPVVWSNVSAGIKNTDRSFLELARVYDFSFFKTARSIYFPSVLPYFRSACSSALGFGWKAGIAAEVLTVPGVSIGRMIYESKLYLQTTDLFAWTLCVILLSFLLEKLMLRLISGGRKNA